MSVSRWGLASGVKLGLLVPILGADTGQYGGLAGLSTPDNSWAALPRLRSGLLGSL